MNYFNNSNQMFIRENFEVKEEVKDENVHFDSEQPTNFYCCGIDRLSNIFEKEVVLRRTGRIQSLESCRNYDLCANSPEVEVTIRSKNPKNQKQKVNESKKLPNFNSRNLKQNYTIDSKYSTYEFDKNGVSTSIRKSLKTNKMQAMKTINISARRQKTQNLASRYILNSSASFGRSNTKGKENSFKKFNLINKNSADSSNLSIVENRFSEKSSTSSSYKLKNYLKKEEAKKSNKLIEKAKVNLFNTQKIEPSRKQLNFIIIKDKLSNKGDYSIETTCHNSTYGVISSQKNHIAKN